MSTEHTYRSLALRIVENALFATEVDNQYLDWDLVSDAWGIIKDEVGGEDG